VPTPHLPPERKRVPAAVALFLYCSTEIAKCKANKIFSKSDTRKGRNKLINRESIVDIDIAKNSGIHRTHLNYSIGQTDDDFDIFGVRVFRNGEPVSLTGAQVSGYFLAPDGNAYTCTTGDVSGNVAYIRLDAVCYNVEGQFSLSIKLTGGGISGTVRIVDGTVMNTYETDATPAPAQDPSWAEILAAYTEATGFMDGITDAAGTLHNLAAVPVNLPNLLDGTTWTNGYITGDGEIVDSESDLRHYTGLIEIVHPNEYQIVFTPEENTGYVQIHGYDASGNHVRRFTAINNTSTDFGTRKSYKFTGGDCKYFRISIYKSYTGVWVGQPIEDRISSGDYQNEITMRGNTRRKDLFEGVGWTEYMQIGDNGVPIGRGDAGATGPTPYYRYSDLIKVLPNKRYFLTVYYRADRGTNDITVDGYDGSGNWVKRLRTFSEDEQTPGTMHLWDFYTEDCIQIRVSIVNYMQYALMAYDDLEETIMQGQYTKETIPFEVGGLNYSNGTETSSTTVLRSVGYAELAADFIRAENAIVSIYIYNRNGQFRGIWDGYFGGNALATGADHWYTFVDMQEIRNVLMDTYPNCIYRVKAKIPGNSSPTTADGAKIHFYTKNLVYGTVGIYETWAVIGASGDAGRFCNPGASTGVDHLNYAWPKVLAKAVGNTVTNYSVSGMSAYKFRWGTTDYTNPLPEAQRPLYQVTHDSAVELYVITLGSNDATVFDDTTEPIGEESDLSGGDPAAYPCTFVGNYGCIYEQILAHAPNAKFVFVYGGPGHYNSRRKKVHDAVRMMAAHYGVPCIDWADDEVMRSNVMTKHFEDSHQTKVMYGARAQAFDRLFGKAVGKNVEYFA